MNFCFVKVLTQQQQQKTYLAKLIDFLRNVISNGSTLLVFALTEPSNAWLSLKWVKEMYPNVICTHCIIHRQAFTVKTMPDELLHVLNNAIKAGNFIKANALNSRLLQNCARKVIAYILVLDSSRREKC